MTDCLIVFGRYPEVGKCKTRLIPALGAQGAAQLHQELTCFTLSWAQRLARRKSVVTEIHFAGGSEAAMRAVFGDHFNYVPQCGEDLGSKMKQAVFSAIRNGADKVVVVGTDCPELNEDFAVSALEALDRHDVCISPASDGGYTLLGGRREAFQNPEVAGALFEDIDWGTERVFQQTVGAMSALQSTSLCFLPTRSDVDLPEDLPVWERAKAGQVPKPPALSVIIPVLGTESNLDSVLQAVGATANAATEVEAIVVAAGEVVKTQAVAAKHLARLQAAPANRAQQMNLGASHARGDSLLFLHADTILPDGFAASVQAALAKPRCAGGAFRLGIDSKRWMARILEASVQLRSTWFQLPYGDQAIFVRRSRFEELGGFREQSIMEDYEFIRRLRKTGRIEICSTAVWTSPRRWHQLGFLRTTLINQMIIAGYHFGFSTETLARLYRRRR